MAYDPHLANEHQIRAKLIEDIHAAERMLTNVFGELFVTNLDDDDDSMAPYVAAEGEPPIEVRTQLLLNLLENEVTMLTTLLEDLPNKTPADSDGWLSFQELLSKDALPAYHQKVLQGIDQVTGHSDRTDISEPLKAYRAKIDSLYHQTVAMVRRHIEGMEKPQTQAADAEGGVQSTTPLRDGAQQQSGRTADKLSTVEIGGQNYELTVLREALATLSEFYSKTTDKDGNTLSDEYDRPVMYRPQKYVAVVHATRCLDSLADPASDKSKALHELNDHFTTINTRDWWGSSPEDYGLEPKLGFARLTGHPNTLLDRFWEAIKSFVNKFRPSL